MHFFKIKTLDEALNQVVEIAETQNLEVESVSLESSHGRICCENVYSKVNIPSFDRSTVDGYAIKTSDVAGATDSIPAMLTLKGNSIMGQAIHDRIESGEAIYVPTGGMLPKGADGVVMIEHSEKISEDMVLIFHPVAYGENIIYSGDDLKKDQLILPHGKCISAYDMGLLAGAGISALSVYKKVRVAVLSTGDEIVDCNEPMKMGQIRDINGYSISGAVVALGGVVVLKTIVKDEMEALRNSVLTALELADLVILSGGSSVGTRDFTQRVIESFDEGRILVHGISVKPGKPTIVGSVKDKMIFGLPGHPTASALVFEILVRPYIERLMKLQNNSFEVKARVTESIHSSPGKDTFIMVTLSKKEDDWIAKPLLGKSGLISLMAGASGYIQIKSDQEGLYKDEEVSVTLFKRGEI